MPESFHRRGHHVQKAHGRRAHFAADGSHLSGAMIALMPTAADARRLALPGGEKAADLHCTLLFLGDDGEAWPVEVRDAMEAAAVKAASELTPVLAKVFGVAHWNGNGDDPSWVWNVGDDPGRGLADSTLHEVHHTVGDILGMCMAMCDGEMPEPPQQHSPWAAHICAAYTDDLTLARTLEKRLGPVTFDRIRLSFGDDDRDIPLTARSVSLTASALRRDPEDHEEFCDFAEHNRQWEGAVQTATGRMISVYAGWRTWIAEQIKAGADTPEEWASITLGPDQGIDQAAEVLHEAMTSLALRAGQALAREAEKQGVKIPEWNLPDDTVTAAVGGRRLLSSVARMTADLLATSVVQTAKRTVTGLFTRQAPPDQVAAEVDRALTEAQDSLLRGPVGTAMSTAQTAGRQAVLEAAPPGEYYASEILDRNTCAPCKAVDGEQFSSLEIAIKAYPVMGYKDCVGPKYGHPCRGMIVARWTPEAEPVTASAEEFHGSLGDPDHHTKHPDGRRAKTGTAATLLPDTGMIGEGTVPWHTVHNHSDCASGEWAVVKDSDNSVAGCHGSKADADKHLSALYASEGDATVTTEALKQGVPSEGTKKDKRLKENHPYEITGPDPADIGGENTAPWRGPITVEGVETGDGREFDSGSLTWADLPLPLRWNKEDSHGGQPRTLAVNVGRIDKVWREDSGLIMGEGLLDLGNEDGREVHRKIKGEFLRGISVDVDSVKDADMELIWPDHEPDGSGEPDPFAQMFAAPEKVVFHKGRIRAATLVDIPAFAEAYVALIGDDGAVTAGGKPIGAMRASMGVRTRTRVVQAPFQPPADWFANPDLSVPTGITVTPEGRVYGHAALWGTCHIGKAGMCVTPPREEDHPYFMTGNVWTEEGNSTRVGQITVGTNHAPLHLGYRAASDHYDNTGAAVADVVVGNDAHGIWVAGSIRYGVSQERIHELRAAGQVSGDWRRIGGQLRLVGLLAVNVPGFPVPKLRTTYASGQQLALVAAGMPDLTEHMTEDDLDQWAYARVMGKLSSRVHGGE